MPAGPHTGSSPTTGCRLDARPAARLRTMVPEVALNADEILAALFTTGGREDPYPLYAALHQLGPVAALTPGEVGPHAAVVHGYDAVDQVLRSPDFRVADGRQLASTRPDWPDHPALRTLMSSMMFSNAPDHARMRRLFHQVFTPRRVTALEPTIVAIVDSLLDRLAHLGADGAEVDYLAEFAYLLPTRVVGALLGIPDHDLTWFRPRVQRINDYLDLRDKTTELLQVADDAAAELHDYYLDMIARRRAAPRDDLVSSLVQALDAGEYELDEAELVSNLIVLFNAGFVTTTNMLGNGLALLLERPAQVAALLADPAAASGCVDEILRYDTSVQFTVRWAAADTDLWGVSVPRGAGVLVLLAAANRDPRRFARPDVFDPDRPANQPISFGSGPHYCLGAALARAEGRLAFPMVFRRFPRLTLGTRPVRSRQLLLRGFSVLPVVCG